MARSLPTTLIAIAIASSHVSGALAGIPRGLVLAADEQIADEATGTTIARGNAELIVEKYAIRGRADTIEVRPAINEVLLKGKAVLAVGARSYASETLSCTLDFARCVRIDADQPLPASAFSTGDAETLPR